MPARGGFPFQRKPGLGQGDEAAGQTPGAAGANLDGSPAEKPRRPTCRLRSVQWSEANSGVIFAPEQGAVAADPESA
jgi:hypothetical protein